MNLYADFRTRILDTVQALQSSGQFADAIDTSRITAEPPRDPAHGDIATNAALIIAKADGRSPRTVAEALVKPLAALPDIAEASVAGPGFINLRLTDAFWIARIKEILADGQTYGGSDQGQGRSVVVEYVSANPTGPLHIGHARGAVVGDALANLLAKAGWEVTREYYVNDAGSQIDALAESLALRIREAKGEDIGTFTAAYPGDYLKDVARKIVDREAEHPIPAEPADFKLLAVAAMLRLIFDDLTALGVKHDRHVSEFFNFHGTGAIEAVVRDLEAMDLAYVGMTEAPKGQVDPDWEPQPRLLLRSSALGDVEDRTLRTSDGRWTYLAPDLAYHVHKKHGGFERIIDVWGADHVGYVARLKGALHALTGAELEVLLCQMVTLLDGGKPVRMSKREGNFVWLKDAIERVGADALRFTMLTRRHDQRLDFDFQAVVAQSKDNPVFYVQYAHARTCSALAQAHKAFPDADYSDAALRCADLSPLSGDELGLAKKLATWPRVVEAAAAACEPHRIATYLIELAGAFHALWTRGNDDPSVRFVRADAPELTRARLALLRATGLVLASGLSVLGVKPADRLGPNE